MECVWFPLQRFIYPISMRILLIILFWGWCRLCSRDFRMSIRSGWGITYWDEDFQGPFTGEELISKLEDDPFDPGDERDWFNYSIFCYFYNNGNQVIDYDEIMRTYLPLALANIIALDAKAIVLEVNNTGIFKLIP